MFTHNEMVTDLEGSLEVVGESDGDFVCGWELDNEGVALFEGKHEALFDLEGCSLVTELLAVVEAVVVVLELNEIVRPVVCESSEFVNVELTERLRLRDAEERLD